MVSKLFGIVIVLVLTSKLSLTESLTLNIKTILAILSSIFPFSAF